MSLYMFGKIPTSENKRQRELKILGLSGREKEDFGVVWSFHALFV